MSDEVLDAIKEEVDLLSELIDYMKEQTKDREKASLGDIQFLHRLTTTHNSLRRIVNRVEKKTYYRLGIKEGKVTVIAE